MPFRLDIYHHIGDINALSSVTASLDRIEQLLVNLTEKGEYMSVELDNLTREVAEMSTVVDSAVTLISGLAEQIRALQNDPVALAALANSLDTKANELATAVSANTTPTP